jgi:hypothetical protein
MKNKLQRNFKLIGVALALVFGIGTLTSVQAQQNQNNRQDRRNDNQSGRRNDNNRNDNDRNRDDDDRYNDNRGNGNYGNNNNIYGSRNNSVLRQAYADGLRKGADDARDGDRFNPNKAVGKAMRQFNNGRNNNGISGQDYRDAFIRGYERGFRQYDDRNGRGNNSCEY